MSLDIRLEKDDDAGNMPGKGDEVESVLGEGGMLGKG